jgi:hypothetical protein
MPERDRDSGTPSLRGSAATGQFCNQNESVEGDMKNHAFAFAALLLTIAQVGCSSMAPVTRGQSPAGADPQVQTASHHHGGHAGDTQHTSVNLHEAIYDHHHATEISYYPAPGGGYGPGCPPGACPPYGCPNGNCPIGYHDSYVMGPCGPACGPQHHMTYSYSRPSDLRYPDQSTTGGAIVYPYYTLKGPSCFFRDDDRREMR